MKDNCTTPTNSSPPLSGEERQLISKIRAITCKGNDAEVRRKKDGSLMVYEVKKKAV